VYLLVYFLTLDDQVKNKYTVMLMKYLLKNSKRYRNTWTCHDLIRWQAVRRYVNNQPVYIITIHSIS